MRSLVIVLGSSSSIGKSIANSLSYNRLAYVLAVSRRPLEFQETYIHNYSPHDLTDPGFLPTLTSYIERSGFTLKGIVFNQAHTPLHRLDNLTDDDVTLTLDTIIRFPISAIRELKKFFDPDSRIVLIGSIASLRRSRTASSVYTASKHALVGLTKHLSSELANVATINLICPSQTYTDALFNNLDVSEIRTIESCHPMGRLCHPEEIANIVSYLIFQAPRYLTGSIIEVCGGL